MKYQVNAVQKDISDMEKFFVYMFVIIEVFIKLIFFV